MLTTKCSNCKIIPTSHYYVNEKKGTNTFFSNNTEKEVCGVATCYQCRSRFGDKDEKYMNYCIVCAAEIKYKEENKTVNKKRKVNHLPSRQSTRGQFKRNTRVGRNKK